jgi:hypothetical protein
MPEGEGICEEKIKQHKMVIKAVSRGIKGKIGKKQRNIALCPKIHAEIFWKKVKLEWKKRCSCDILSNGNMSSLYLRTYKEQFSW